MTFWPSFFYSRTINYNFNSSVTRQDILRRHVCGFSIQGSRQTRQGLFKVCINKFQLENFLQFLWRFYNKFFFSLTTKLQSLKTKQATQFYSWWWTWGWMREVSLSPTFISVVVITDDDWCFEIFFLSKATKSCILPRQKMLIVHVTKTGQNLSIN